METTRDERHSKRTIAPLFTWRSAIAESDLTPTTRHVLLALSLYMNERGGSAYPGSARLARDTGLHQTTVKHRLQEAVTRGWLRVVTQGGSEKGGVRLATEYVASVPVDNRPGAEDTRSSERTDRARTIRRPGAEGDPISSRITPENSRIASQISTSAASGLAPDPECVRCRGVGLIPMGGDVGDRPCSCCDPRPIVAYEGADA